MYEDFRLRIFVVTAEERSFTRAAETLGISQPAVSQNIAELEKVTGLRLFERQRGEVSLTPQGEIFREYALRILSSYAGMNNLFSNPRIAKQPESDMIRLYISPVLETLLPSLTARLGIIRPSLPVETVVSPEFADVSIIARTRKTDAGFSIEVSVNSDDRPLADFFRELLR